MQGLSFRMWGVGSHSGGSLVLGVQGAGCRVQGSGFRVQGAWFRVWGVGCGGYSGGVEVFDLLDARLLPEVARNVQVEHLIQA